jgi:hypothetical protein
MFIFQIGIQLKLASKKNLLTKNIILISLKNYFDKFKNEYGSPEINRPEKEILYHQKLN